jgi:hypothetical protein
MANQSEVAFIYFVDKINWTLFMTIRQSNRIIEKYVFKCVKIGMSKSLHDASTHTYPHKRCISCIQRFCDLAVPTTFLQIRSDVVDAGLRI